MLVADEQCGSVADSQLWSGGKLLPTRPLLNLSSTFYTRAHLMDGLRLQMDSLKMYNNSGPTD